MVADDSVRVAAMAALALSIATGGGRRRCRIFRCRRARIRTTSRRRPTARSGTPRRAQGALGILDPKTAARLADSARHRTRRRTASSSAPTAPPGSPKAGRTPSRASIRPTMPVKLFPLPAEFRRRQSQHRDLRPQRHSLVHRAERRLWPRRSGDRQGRSLEGAEGRRALRHHHDAEGRRLVRLARRRSHRQDRHRERRRCDGAAAASPGVGPRRIWSDSKGVLWVSFWNSGEVGRYDPIDKVVEGLADCRRTAAAAATRSMSTTRTRSG